MDVIINNDYLNSLVTWSIKQIIPLPIPHVSLISILTTKFPALFKSLDDSKKTPRLYKSYFSIILKFVICSKIPHS